MLKLFIKLCAFEAWCGKIISSISVGTAKKSTSLVVKIVRNITLVDLVTTVTTTAFTVLVNTSRGTYNPALNGVVASVATIDGPARQLMYNFVNRTCHVPMSVALDNRGAKATMIPERVVAFWIARLEAKGTASA